MKTGLKIKKYIKSNEENHILVIKETIAYNLEDINNKYIPALSNLIDKRIIMPTNFESNHWLAANDIGETCSLYFKFELYSKINTALKCYIILKFSEQNTSPINAHKALNIISKMLLISNFFNDKYFENTYQEFKLRNHYQFSYIGYIKEFIKFYPLDISQKYLDMINSIHSVRSNSRKLPSYRSIINFDYLIQDFISNDLISQNLKFVPIIIWWELTKIIPMRPIEFAILKKDCLFTKDNNYFIKIERRKKKNGQVSYKTVKVLTEFQIPFGLYTIIDNYINNISNIIKGNFIFSFETHKIFARNTSKESLYDFVGMDNLCKLLIKFFSEIIGKHYNYEVISKEDFLKSNSSELKDFQIERLQLGDTRHIAFCGMMLQGFNPLTIAQIGGHYTLSEQTSYCNHLETFIDSYTFMLTKSLSNKVIKNIPAHTIKPSKKSLIKKEALGSDFYSLLKVKNGRCSSKNFPHDCMCDNHIYCDYFIPDETLTYELLTDNLNQVNEQIQHKIKYIKSFTESLLKDSNSIKIETELKTNTNSLNTLIKQKAVIENYRLKILEEIKNE